MKVGEEERKRRSILKALTCTHTEYTPPPKILPFKGRHNCSHQYYSRGITTEVRERDMKCMLLFTYKEKAALQHII